MNVFTDFFKRVHSAIQVLVTQGDLPAGLDLSRIIVESPRDPSHGDLATNAAMIIARSADASPRDIAEKLANILDSTNDVKCTKVAGPGFINLHLADAYWHAALRDVLVAGDRISRLNIGAGQRVNVEYVSANPTGPLHIGHCRGAVFGDALANLLEHVGYEVTREYYINDAGAQIDVLARSVFLRYREALGEPIGSIPEILYPGDYLIKVGEDLVSKFGDSLQKQSEEEWLPVIREFTITLMMQLIREDLSVLGVKHDLFFFETTLHSGNPNAIECVIQDLMAKGLIYQGVLPPPKGKLPDDWENREQTLFRASEFGDSMDRPLVKSDGSYTYFAADIAYFYNKFGRGFEQMVYVLGADHDGYVKRLEAVSAAVANSKTKVVVRLCRLVRLSRGGRPIKMSKRAGAFVTMRGVVNEVGPDALRFMMLFRSNEASLDFDFAKVVEQSRDNPVFYVQYAHARACSVLRKAEKMLHASDLSIDTLKDVDLSVLSNEDEVKMIKRLAAFRRTLESAARLHEPHKIAFYLYEVAGEFHALWNKGKESPQLRFINADDLTVSCARIALIQSVILVLSRGMHILGVEAVREMC